MVHHILKPEQKGRLISLPTETDRTLFFDFLPLDLGQIKGFRVRFHLYTVPGQVFYNATRRLVLQGVDGVVFVADSQVDMMGSNIESLKNLHENLSTYGKKLAELPFVMQYNKRDLKNIASVQEMSKALNAMAVPVYEGVAKDGLGVTETLVGISRLVFANLRKTLLLPGDAAEAEEIAGIPGVAADEQPSPEGADLLEEISEIEEIHEVQEIPELEKIPDVQEIPETTEVPEGVEMIVPPRQVSPAPYPEEASDEGGESREEPAEEETVSPMGDIPDEIEIEIPETFDDPADRQVSDPGISLKVKGEGLTFLKFEGVFVSPEGHAVLPAVFLDAEGNPVQIRIRISMEEGRE
jgi:signal recognition particle receptor subunit beta